MGLPIAPLGPLANVELQAYRSGIPKLRNVSRSSPCTAGAEGWVVRGGARYLIVSCRGEPGVGLEACMRSGYFRCLAAGSGGLCVSLARSLCLGQRGNSTMWCGT